MFRTLSQARTYNECNARLPELLDELSASVDELRSGKVPLAELTISRHLSREPGAYKTDTVLSEAAKDLASRGVHLSAGETIQLVIVDA